MTTLVLAASEDINFLWEKLKQVLESNHPSFAKLMVTCQPGQKSKIIAKLSPVLKRIELVEIHSLRQDLLPLLITPYLAYLPPRAPYSPPFSENSRAPRRSFFLQPLIPLVTAKANECARSVYLELGWVSTTSIFSKMGWEESLNLRDLERVSREAQIQIPYLSSPASPSFDEPKSPGETPPKISNQSKILAMVPHFNCQAWLVQCLYSLVNQTRPPDAIAVLDDASANPPLDIIRKFKNITLLRSNENVGPYRLLQSAISQSRFDAYLFQDADDWSSLDRLEMLIGEAERTGAEWIGTQELMYFEDAIHAVRYPTNLNLEPQTTVHNPYCYPSSLISKRFLTGLGGFASGLRFSGDFELLTRALFAGKVANLDRYAYFRRIRKNSLITSEDTGLGSPARWEVDFQIKKRKAENLDRVKKGEAPLLGPIKTAEPIVFEHMAGPPLN